ncbi:MAG: 3'-5' exonuclease [Candidatus Aenigmarchaeota archaeon]|nr:3'-5' exonuclease [Candidatus Aenigmarchaeota archaeon]
MENTKFVILDIETTGLSRHMHKITEFSALKVNVDNNTTTFNTIDRYSTLINPQRRIPSFITSLTGITNNMVKDAPTFPDVSADIRKFIANNVIIAHNTTFDYNFLNHNFKETETDELENNALCTCKLSRRLIPNLSSYKLENLCSHLRINNQQAHRAMSDVMATKDLFSNLYRHMKKRNIHTVEDAIRFQKSRIIKH